MTKARDLSVVPNQSLAFKNKIINGAMVIDQRNAGVSVTPTVNGTYCLDRYRCSLSQASKYAVQQANAAGSPVGFTKLLAVTSLSAYSITSTDFFTIQQRIEGNNIADLYWGTANAKAVTLSFWAFSSLSGTFGGALRNNDGNRSYPFTYTLSANTWTFVTINIAGDTSGTWATDTNTGIEINWGLGVGSTFSGTAGAWAAGNFTSATGATSVVGTNGATFYITGVQLEVGSNATSFDYRPYGTELALCQRYYFRKDIVPGDSFTVFQAYNTGNAYGKLCDLPVTMRATPVGSLSAIGSFRASNASGTSGAAFTVGSVDSVSTTSIGTGGWTGASGLTAGNATVISCNPAAWIAASAEL